MYESAATLYVSSPNLSDYQSVLGAQQAAKGFALFPRSDGVIEATLKAVGARDLSLSQLLSMVTVENDLNSQFIVIKVRNSDPELAARLASVIANQAITLLMASQNGFRVTVVQQAEVPIDPVGLGPAIVLAIGMLVGLVVIVCTILFIEQTNGILVIRPGDQITVLDQETGLPAVITVRELPAIERSEQEATLKLRRIVVPQRLSVPLVPETPTDGVALNGLDPQSQKRESNELLGS